jgi:hypothetical protein
VPGGPLTEFLRGRLRRNRLSLDNRTADSPHEARDEESPAYREYCEDAEGRAMELLGSHRLAKPFGRKQVRIPLAISLTISSGSSNCVPCPSSSSVNRMAGVGGHGASPERPSLEPCMYYCRTGFISVLALRHSPLRRGLLFLRPSLHSPARVR